MELAASSPRTSQRTIMRLQIVTVAWMLVECLVALFSAWQAQSVSLLAFGSDSLVELISASVVLLQFTSHFQISQIRAARFCGALLYVLAGVVCVIALAGLIRQTEVDTSLLGIGVTGAALLLMPLLAQKKREIANRTGNKALRADAVQSASCAYLAALTLANLILRSAFGVHWLDQVAALLAVPILIVEGKRARRGQSCACC